MSLKEKLLRPIPAESLGLFRIGFGVFMIIELAYFLSVGFTEAYIEFPAHNFSYVFGPQSSPSPGAATGLIALGLVASIGIILGKWLRLFAGIFLVAFGYLFLIDKSIYNNHVYLFCLLAFILMLIPASKGLALVGKDKKQEKTVPAWTLWILRFQVVVVYFFGGVAKLNTDWLSAQEPARTILNIKAQAAGDWVASEALVGFVCYGGVAFDLLIGFALLWKKTRKLAILGAIFFNLTNAWLFNDINIFPFFMLFTIVLFLEPETTAKWFRKKKTAPRKGKAPEPIHADAAKWALPVATIYCVIQLILPLRHYFIPGHADWTGEGQRFAWRMKIFHKEVEQLQFAIFDLSKGPQPFEARLGQHLNSEQIAQMANDPEMLLQMGHFLGENARKNLGVSRPVIKVAAKISLNGRPARYVISPDLDLLKLEWNKTGHNEWLEPLPARGDTLPPAP